MFLFWLHAAEANTLARSWSLAAWTLGFGRRSLSKREELSASSFGFSWDEHTVHVGSFAVSASRSSNEPNLSCFVGFLARPWCPMYFGRMTQSFGVSLRLLPRKLFMSCPLFKESRTREGAEAAIEEELRPLADKPLLERTGGIRCSWCRCCVHAQGALFGVLAWCTASLPLQLYLDGERSFLTDFGGSNPPWPALLSFSGLLTYTVLFLFTICKSHYSLLPICLFLLLPCRTILVFLFLFNFCLIGN